MATSVAIVVKYKKETFSLSFGLTQSVVDLKEELTSLTGIIPSHQKLLGLPKLPTGISEGQYLLSSLPVKKRKFMLMGTPGQNRVQEVSHAEVPSISPLLSSEPWMEKYYQQLASVPLNRLPIAGTHNSASYSIDAESPFSPEGSSFEKALGSLSMFGNGMKGIVSSLALKFSVCQKQSVLKQLRDGIRYLDLRVCLMDGGVYVTHNLRGCLLQNVLAEVHTFISETKNEIVIIDIQHLYAFDTSASLSQLYELVVRTLGKELLASRQELSPGSLLSEFVSLKKRIVVLCDALDESPLMWSNASVQRIWADSPDAATVVQSLNTTLADVDLTVCGESGAPLVVEQFVVTPTTATVMSAALTQATLHSLASSSNTTFAAEWKSRELGRAEKSCIAIVDFYDESEVLNYVSHSLKELLEQHESEQ